MTITTNVLNFTHDRGDTFLLEGVVKNTNETVKDLTGTTAVRFRIATIRSDHAVVLTKTLGDGVTITDALGGVLQCALTAAEVATILTAKQYVYDIELAMGVVEHTVLKG